MFEYCYIHQSVNLENKKMYEMLFKKKTFNKSANQFIIIIFIFQISPSNSFLVDFIF